jgi:hypothetical protein
MKRRPKTLRAFTKSDSAKSRLDLTPAAALELVGHVLRIGGEKYAEENWRLCKDPARYIGPILRHAMRHMKGEFLDRESGLPHLAHLVCSALFALDLYLKGEQDRFTMGNYFAIVRRRSGKKGVIVKRFNSYAKAWATLDKEELDLRRYMIKTVTSAEKTGAVVRLHA